MKREVVIPIAMVFARLLFALLIQLLLSIPLTLQEAGQWWPIYGNLIDLFCLAVMYFVLKSENISLLTEIKNLSNNIKLDFKISIKYTMLLFPMAILGMMLSNLLLYHSPQPVQPIHPLPLIPSLYSVTIFPIVWAFTEQFTYQEFALKRLRPSLGNISIIIVAFGWALQHIALPFTTDLTFSMYRFFSFIPIALLMPILYLRKKRLLPIIIAHWFMDSVAMISQILLPLLMQ